MADEKTPEQIADEASTQAAAWRTKAAEAEAEAAKAREAEAAWTAEREAATYAATNGVPLDVSRQRLAAERAAAAKKDEPVDVMALDRAAYNAYKRQRGY